MTSYLISEAHDWLGTKFKHLGRIKKTTNDNGGCDCLGLIMGLQIQTKFGDNLKKYDPITYPKILNSNLLLEQLDKLLIKIPESQISLGDIILIRINEWPQHLAVVVEKKGEHITIIHSYLQARRVVKQYLPSDWEIVAVYRSNTTFLQDS